MASAGTAKPTTHLAWASCMHKIDIGEVPSITDIAPLCSSGLLEVLVAILYEQLEAQLATVFVKKFWQQLQICQQQADQLSRTLLLALQELAGAVQQQTQQLSSVAQQLLLMVVQHHKHHQQHHAEPQQDDGVPASTVALLAGLCHKYRTAVASLIMSTAPFSLPGLLQRDYQQRLLELSDVIQQQQQQEQEAAAMEASSEEVDAMSEDAAALQSPDGSVGGHRLRSETPVGDPLLVLGQTWAAELSGMAAAMDSLGLSAASEEAYTQVINRYVLQQLRSLASGELDTAVLPRARRLVCAGPLEFLRLVLAGDQHVELKVQEWQLRLTYLMLETLGALRSADMFNIVIDYPDSAPALQDLAMCLQHTNMAGHFAATFKAALQQRLLHAGAATADIIHTYVSTIRAMKQVDASGLLLDVVSEPIRAYLRSRPDTIRCIVSMLTEDPADAANGAAGSSLLEELQEQQQALGGFSHPTTHLPPKHSKYNWCVTETEGDEAALRLLEALEVGPDGASEQAQDPAEQSSLAGLPVHAAPAASVAYLSAGLGGRADGDVVSMLIGIYGGPLLFMEEYRNMLSDRLLAKDNYDCQREIRTLELLKIRFGEAGLHPCEVMLKDLADSKRLDANIRELPRQQALQQQTVHKLPDHVAAALERTRATICSYLFWPELPERDMVLPNELKEAVQVYSERFRHLKAPRKLRWLPTIGLVELTLTVGDSEPCDFKVTPVHAALLMQFADNNSSATAAAPAAQGGKDAEDNSKTAAKLSSALGVPVPVVRKKAMFWVSAGVLVERRGAAGEVTYSRATSIDPSRIVSREVTDLSWQEDTGASSSVEDRVLAEMGPYENYVMGLLTNCGILSIDRLHNMLRVFVVGEPKYEGKTQEQLAALLQIMVAKQKIDVTNGVYSRRKTAT